MSTINHFQASPHDHLPQPKPHVLLLLPGLSQRKTARTREPFEKQGGSILQPGFRRVRKRLYEEQKRRGVHSSDQKQQGEQGRGVELSHPGARCPAAFRLWLPPVHPLGIRLIIERWKSLSAAVENAHLALDGTKGTIEIRLWNTAYRRQESLR